MITGEERLREYLADLYSNVVGYEGRPSQAQVDRTAALSRELSDVVKEFDAWIVKNLKDLNAALAQKNLPPLTQLGREEWEKKSAP